MSGQLVTPPEPNALTEETRTFWREVGQTMIKESIAASDGVAKQLIGVAGILEGLYFHAIALSDLRDPAKYPASAITIQWWAYLLPIGLLLLSLVFALSVFFPVRYHLNAHSSEASKIVFERIAARKLWLVRAAALCLMFGVAATMNAAYLYLITGL